MSRKVIPLVTGEIYHVFNRGVDRRIIFHDHDDYLRFYESLHWFNTKDPVFDLQRARNKDHDPDDRLVEISAYALLENHFHLIIKQLAENGLAELMKRIGAGYTGYYNEKYKRSGVLFQGKYKRVHVESDEQLRYLLAYVNHNHVVHGVDTPKHMYATSSLHMTQQGVSKIISHQFSGYDVSENIKLASNIYKKRKTMKTELFE